jgi:hypothetical protein
MKTKKITTKQQLVAHGYYSSTANIRIKVGIFKDIPGFIYLLMPSTVSYKTLNGILVEPLLENTVLETENGSN